jgi:hypothetical protein
MQLFEGLSELARYGDKFLFGQRCGAFFQQLAQALAGE